MKFGHISAAVLALGLMAGSAMAATVGFTEGTRDAVNGTTAIGGDVAGGAVGFDLDGASSVGNGAAEFSQIDVYGRVVNGRDTYNFSATTNFLVSLIFGGYETGAGLVAQSGFVAEASGSNTSEFSLTGLTPLSLTTDVTSGASLLFEAGPGDYAISVKGQGSGALYDLRIEALSISVVPLPASGLLLLMAVGGLGFARKRRKAA